MLGSEMAENDPFLDDAFYTSAVYTSIESRTNPNRFLIGRTGSGKSAVLKHLEDIHPDHVIRIVPENLSLPYLLDLDVIQALSALDVHLDPFFIALWKHVLIVEVIRHRYNVDSPEVKQNFLQALGERIQRNPAKRQALQYLEEFGGSFWCETDERVKEVTEKFERDIGLEASGQLPIPGIPLALRAGRATKSGIEIRLDQKDRYQRIVNSTQLPRLNKMIDVLDQDILDSDLHFTYVLIDDLDRDWVNERLSNDLIRCLFRAVLDLQGAHRLKVVVALRTNIFENLNFGSISGGQEEKFRGLSLKMNWTEVELTELADERVRVASTQWNRTELKSIAQLLPNAGRRGNPLDYMLSRTLRRPRDLIAFVNECLRRATGGRLTWADLTGAEPTYSKNRLMALRDEWKPTFIGIDQVFHLFRRTQLPLDRAGLSLILDEVGLLLAEEAFPGSHWLTAYTQELWNGTPDATWYEQYQPLTRLLYEIGFLGLQSSPTAKPKYAYDEPDLATFESNFPENVHFTIHPAFRSALDLRTADRGAE
jgi:energy-coupling factor transporter ATP-binding protein EcfA2